jgi:hypothetical protein
MSDSSETNRLLTEIRDLLVQREKLYAEYLARHAENDEKYLARVADNKRQVAEAQRAYSRSRVGLFILALIIGVFLWAFMMWVIVKVM